METATGLGALIVQWRMLHSETQPEGDVREERQMCQPGRRSLDGSPFEPVEQRQRKMDENTFPYSIKSGSLRNADSVLVLSTVMCTVEECSFPR